MGDAAGLLLSFVALLAHDFDVLFEGLGSLLEDSDLLACCGLVVVELMHLIVMELDISGEIGASALVDTDFFSKLGVLHLKHSNPILYSDHLPLFFLNKTVRLLNLLINCRVVALNRTLELDTLRCVNFKRSILLSQSLQLVFHHDKLVSEHLLLLVDQHPGTLTLIIPSTFECINHT